MWHWHLLRDIRTHRFLPHLFRNSTICHRAAVVNATCLNKQTNSIWLLFVVTPPLTAMCCAMMQCYSVTLCDAQWCIAVSKQSTAMQCNGEGRHCFPELCISHCTAHTLPSCLYLSLPDLFLYSMQLQLSSPHKTTPSGNDSTAICSTKSWLKCAQCVSNQKSDCRNEVGGAYETQIQMIEIWLKLN